MKAIFLALGLTAATIAPTFAANEHEVYGAGFQHCSVISKTAKNLIGRIAVTAFVGGYLSGANAFSEQKDIAHGISLDDIVLGVLKHCEDNPKDQGETAIISVLMNIGTAHESE